MFKYVPSISQNEKLDEPHFLKGIAFVGLSRNLEAADAFRACLKKNPKRDDAYVYLGSIELMNGFFEQAEKQLRSAISLNAKNAVAHQVLGQTYLAQKRYERAEEALRESIKLSARGKVRDIYDLGDSLLFVATDRLSA